MVRIEITDEWVEIRQESDRANSVMAHAMVDGSVTLESSGRPFLARPEQVEAWAAALQSLAGRARRRNHVSAGRRETGDLITGSDAGCEAPVNKVNAVPNPSAAGEVVKTGGKQRLPGNDLSRERTRREISLILDSWLTEDLVWFAAELRGVRRK